MKEEKVTPLLTEQPMKLQFETPSKPDGQK